MAYKVKIERAAEKALEKISKPFYSRIKTAILNLGDTPAPLAVKN